VRVTRLRVYATPYEYPEGMPEISLGLSAATPQERRTQKFSHPEGVQEGRWENIEGKTADPR